MQVLSVMAVALCVATTGNFSQAASLSYVGSDFDIGGTFFPGGSAPYTVVPWRSETSSKAFDVDGNDVYGSAGYAMFATQFNWPNQGCCGASVAFDSATYPNLIELPSFVAGSQNLTTNKVGGWNYALVDDPELVNGFRDYNWGDNLSPPVDPPNSQSPYVKIGTVAGSDIYGNDPLSTPAGRWAFEIGPNPPEKIRVGIMTDGLDANHWAADEVLLAELEGSSFSNSVTSGSIDRNRFVDIHTFDIVDAQEGDQFAVLASAAPGGNGSISGVTFDYIPEPSGLILSLMGMFSMLGLRKRVAR